MKILAFNCYYLPGYKGGGPIKTLKNLFDKTGEEITFKLVTSDRDHSDSAAYTSVKCNAWNNIGNVLVFYAQAGINGYLQIARHLIFNDHDIIYLNSFFSPRFSFFPLVIAKLLRQKVVLGPRGEFSERALEIKPKKKRIFISLFKLLGFHYSTVFQASSEYEAVDIRRVLGSNVDIRVAADIGAQQFAEPFRLRTSGPLKSVFISRISKIKNLDGALKILKMVHQPIVYEIYGPIEDKNYWFECQKLISDLPSHVQVKYKGPLSPDEVIKTLHNYDVFFLPTKGENYGHVIAEALCAGLPIVIADTTPWRGLQNLGIGWDLPLNKPEAFSVALDSLAVMQVDDHLRMRQNVLSWAKTKFTQRDVIEANIALFKYSYEKK